MMDPYDWSPGDEFIIGNLYEDTNGAKFIFGRISGNNVRGEIVGSKDPYYDGQLDINFANVKRAARYLTPLFNDVSNVPEEW